MAKYTIAPLINSRDYQSDYFLDDASPRQRTIMAVDLQQDADPPYLAENISINVPAKPVDEDVRGQPSFGWFGMQWGWGRVYIE